jgi:hypothetical protein
MNLLQLLAFSYSLTLGANNGALWQYQPLDYVAINWPMEVDLRAEIGLGPFFIGGGTRTDFEMLAWNSYDPTQDTYTFNSGFRFKVSREIEMETGYSHSCYHPRSTYSTIKYLTGQIIAVPRFEGAIDDFYIAVRGCIGGQ